MFAQTEGKRGGQGSNGLGQEVFQGREESEDGREALNTNKSLLQVWHECGGQSAGILARVGLEALKTNAGEGPGAGK